MIKFFISIILAIIFIIPFAIIEITQKDKDEAIYKLVSVGIFYSFFISILLTYFVR